MSRTALLDHKYVRDYFARLDAALRGLPATQARELRAQITTHLEDALPPDADNVQITVALRQLGDPADLAAEARAAMGPTLGQAIRAAARRRWNAFAGARPRTKILAAVIVVLIASGATYADVVASGADVFESAPLIHFAGGSVWWYPQDSNHQVMTSADGAQQITVPIRSDQRQGFLIGIENPSKFTETIIGPVLGDNAPFDSPNGGAGQQMAVSVPDRQIANGGMTRGVAFTSLPASIPPHQYRELRIIWVSQLCLAAGSTSPIIDSLYLRVRVGSVTRTDIIPLLMGWALEGPSHGRCY